MLLSHSAWKDLGKVESQVNLPIQSNSSVVMASSTGKCFHLLDVPSEILLNIFSHVLEAIDICSEPGPALEKPIRRYGLVDEFNFYKLEDDEWRNRDPPPPIHQIKTIPPLLLVNKKISSLVQSLPWESCVRFCFISTVAMMDVLLAPSQQHRIPRLRRMFVHSSPLPIYPIDRDGCYTTHNGNSGVAMLSGLQLDLLEVGEAYLAEDDGFGRQHLQYEVRSWMGSSGWRELHFLMGETHLTEEEVMSFAKTAIDLRTNRNEPDFVFDLPLTPVVRSETTGNITGLRVQTGSEVQQPQMPTVIEAQDGNGNTVIVAEIAQRPAARIDNEATQGTSDGDAENSDSEDLEDTDEEDQEDTNRKDVKRLVENMINFTEPYVICKRGENAHYTMTAENEQISKVLKGLFSRLNWIEIRESGDYLVDDGLTDPCAHL